MSEPRHIGKSARKVVESVLLKMVMLAAGRDPGIRLFRNNVGVAVYPDGHRVAFGLCPGSSDLIGWKSIVVTPDMVGRTIAQFVAVETKATDGRATPAQRNFLDRVRDAGGLAALIRSPDDIATHLGETS